MESESVPRHPIRVVARRTGLTPATIRAWERRYGAVSPVRSEGGQRLYSDRDLVQLDTLRRLTEMGRSISSVAGLSPAEAAALLEEDRGLEPAARRPPTSGEAPDAWTGQAYARLRALDDGGLERILRRALATLGAPAFLEGVAAPLLRQVGSGWESGDVTPAQEHLGSAVIDRVLADIADHAEADDDAPRVVVATLPEERHGLGARLVAAVAALEGWRVSYLGTDLPAHEIAAAATALGADLVAVSVVSDDGPEAAARALGALRGALDPDVELIVGGRAARLLGTRDLPPDTLLMSDLGDFRTHLLDATR